MQNPTPFDALLQTLAANHGLNNGLNTDLSAKTAKTAKADLRKKRAEEDDAAVQSGEGLVPSDEAAQAAPADANAAPLRLAQVETGTRIDASTGGTAASTAGITAPVEAVAAAGAESFPLWPILGGVAAVAAVAGGGSTSAAPAAPVIDAVATDNIINAAEQTTTITGSNEAGATVALTIGANTRAATVNGTTWSYALVADDITAMGEGAETLSATQTDAAGNTSAAGTRAITVDTTVPVFTSATTANFAENATGTVLDATADSDTGIAYTLSGTDAGVFSINSGSGLVTFNSSPNFEIPTDSGANNVYNFNINATDAAGNTAAQEVAVTVTDVVESLAGQATISLGAGNGNLIAPVQVEGKWYYYWDRSGDGTNAGADYTTHNVLDQIFTKDVNGNTNSGVDTTDTYRYATLNGVHVALPTANGGVAYPQGINAYQNGTSYTDAGASSNGTSSSFNELLAIWDAYNGTGTGTNISGVPAGWKASNYWSATPSASGHAGVDLYGGVVNDGDDTNARYVALQVL